MIAGLLKNEARPATPSGHRQRVAVGDKQDREEEERGESAGEHAVDDDEGADAKRCAEGERR